MISKSILWCEDNRPKTVAECILPESLKKAFQHYVDTKEIPNVLLVGGPGMGKTTVAKAMCEEIGCDYMFINSSDERGIDVLRTKIKQYATSMSFTGDRKVIILDEADNLTADCQAALRSAMEEYSNNCTFIFTANVKSRLIEPLQGRCATLEFRIPPAEAQGVALQFFKRVKGILKDKGVSFESPVLVEVIQKYFPDFRKTLNELQRYSIGGKIDVGMLAMISDGPVKEVLGHLKNKDYNAMRQWVGHNVDNSTRIYRRVYDELETITNPSLLADACLIIAKYSFQHAMSADPEVQMAAFFTELMQAGVFG